MVDTEHRTAQILQNCLDAIQAGDETLESVLSLYPDLEDELRPELENALWLMDHQPLLEPDPAFIRQSRQHLMARIHAEQRAAAVAPTSWKDSFLAFFRMPPVVLRAAATVMLVFVLLMGADRVVETTESAIPGDPGYSVKRSVENFTLAVSNDPGQQIVLYLEYSQRRLSETNVLVDESRYTDANKTLDEFQEQVRSAVASLDSVKDADTVHKELLAMTIQEKLSDHNKQLNSLLSKVPSKTKLAVSQAMMVSSDGLAVAQTAIRRLSTMRTPQLGETLPPNGSTMAPTDETIQIVPTEEQLILPQSTPTEEYRQIFSSTVAPTQHGSGVLPTYPVVAPSSTPLPPPPGLPTPVPTDEPLPTRTPRPTWTPVPDTETPLPIDTSTPEPTLSGVSTATPVPPSSTVVPSISSSDTPVPTPLEFIN